MIVPASVYRIAGFIEPNSNEIMPEIQEGGLVLAYTDNGKPVVIKLKTNKKETSLEDIKAYFENKRNSVIRSKDIDLVASELNYFEEFMKKMMEEEAKFKEENPQASFIDLAMFKKSKSEETARQIVVDKKTIKKDSIIKTSLSFKDDISSNTYSFKGIDVPMVESKSLIFDQEDKPTTTGFYYYSQAANSLPIAIKKIFKKDGEALNLFKITLSKLASLDHFNFLVKHTIRTINKQIEKGSGVYLNAPEYDYNMIKNNHELIGILKRMLEISRVKDAETNLALEYIDKMNHLKDLVNQNPKLILHVNLSFGLMLNDSEIRKIITEKDNPLSKLKKSYVNLNYSTEDPNVKEELGLIVEQFIEDVIQGRSKHQIISTYFSNPDSLTEESSSWGYMSNNIQREAFVLSLEATTELSKRLDSALENIKGV